MNYRLLEPVPPYISEYSRFILGIWLCIWDKTFSVISKDPYLRVFRRGTGLIVVYICRCRRIVKFALSNWIILLLCNEYKDCGHFLSIMGKSYQSTTWTIGNSCFESGVVSSENSRYNEKMHLFIHIHPSNH